MKNLTLLILAASEILMEFILCLKIEIIYKKLIEMKFKRFFQD
jgi:hypothetical protein